MWFRMALKNFLKNFIDQDYKKLIEKDNQLVNKDLDKLFNIPYYQVHKGEIYLESKLLILTYMAKLYKNKEYKNTRDGIIKDLKMAIIIAEKVIEDHHVWLSDFIELGALKELEIQEREFLQKLEFKAAFDLDTFKSFIKEFCDPEIVQGLINEFDHHQKVFSYSNDGALLPFINELRSDENNKNIEIISYNKSNEENWLNKASKVLYPSRSLVASKTEIKNKDSNLENLPSCHNQVMKIELLTGFIENLTTAAFLSKNQKINSRISLQAKIALGIIENGLKHIFLTKDRVRLFVGGIILSLMQDDIKYYNVTNGLTKLYPQGTHLQNELGFSITELEVGVDYNVRENFYFLIKVGTAALTQPTLLFPKTLFTKEHKLIQGETLSPFFPAISIDDIDTLMSFIDQEFVNIPKISDNKISDNKISDNKISDNEITDNEITDNEISDNKISDNKISDNKISDNEISDNEISNNKISNNKISNNKISDNKNTFFVNLTNPVENFITNYVYK